MVAYNYPHIIEFLDSVTNLVLIVTLPLIMAGLLYFFTIIFAVTKRDNRVVDAIFISMALILLGGYSYYLFFVLNYFTLFTQAIFSLLTTIIYMLLSPLFLLYVVLSSADIEKSLFLNAGLVLYDIRTWLHLKFGVDINQVTKESLIVSFKLLTLLLFSTKIINVTRFIISSLTHTDSKRDSMAALALFGLIFGLYVFINLEELLKLFHLLEHIASNFLHGGIR